MATTKKTTSTSFTTEIQDMITGFTTSLPSSIRSMLVGGVSMTNAQVLAQFQSILQMLNLVATTKQAWKAAVSAKKAAMAPARTFYSNVEVILRQALGTNQALLAAFGIKPPKTRTKPTSTTKAIAHAKALATRAARGTKGTKQKAAITTTPQPTVQILGPDGQPLGSTAAPGPATPAVPVAPAAPAAPVAPAPVPWH